MATVIFGFVQCSKPGPAATASTSQSPPVPAAFPAAPSFVASSTPRNTSRVSPSPTGTAPTVRGVDKVEIATDAIYSPTRVGPDLYQLDTYREFVGVIISWKTFVDSAPLTQSKCTVYGKVSNESGHSYVFRSSNCSDNGAQLDHKDDIHEAGTYTIAITVTPDGGAPITAQTTVTVLAPGQ
ncbi:hypothetical protein [Nocardia concava]|uniref:hypothetical protein n=1 Tax=Nocardia concava TaxID=257281 RepID=UPI0012F7D3F0|nr:hypothetical protein [Nocardia concava]